MAEQVVGIAHDLLVGPYQEHAQVVGLAAIERMERQDALGLARLRRDEAVDLAVAVAAQIAQHAALRGCLVQAMEGHDGKQLLDRPAIGSRAEDGAIDVVNRCHGGL